MLLLIKYTLLYGIVLMLVALGGMFSEHSGIINIALEGIMVIGGLGGVLAVAMLPNSLPAFVIVAVSILVAALSGMVFSLLLAFAGCLSLYFIIFPQNMQGGEKACFWGINLSYWGKLEAPENREGFT